MPILQSPPTQKPTTVKVFMSGNSQAVRLPKEYRFDVDTLTIQKIGDSVILTPTLNEKTAWENKVNSVFALLDDYANQYPNDTFSVEKLPLQEREPLNFGGDW